MRTQATAAGLRVKSALCNHDGLLLCPIVGLEHFVEADRTCEPFVLLALDFVSEFLGQVGPVM